MSEQRKCQTGLTPEQARAEHDEMMVKSLEFAQQDRDRLAVERDAIAANLVTACGNVQTLSAELAAAKVERKGKRLIDEAKIEELWNEIYRMSQAVNTILDLEAEGIPPIPEKQTLLYHWTAMFNAAGLSRKTKN
jgi:hypothetical protein